MKKLFTLLFIAVISANAFAQMPCQAYFTYTFNPSGGTYVNLYDASYNWDSTQINVTSWTWTATYGGAVHTYTGQNPIIQLNGYSGNVPVCLTITTTYMLQTCQSTWCDTVILNNTPPMDTCIADFSYQVDTAAHTIQCTNQSYTNNGTFVAWFWTLNQNGMALLTSTLQNPVFTYPANGLYSLCLQTTTDSGCMDQSCQTINVNNPNTGCLAAFTHQVSLFYYNEYQFYDQSTTNNGNIVSWNWTVNYNGANIGGTTQQNPGMTFWNDGLYVICLTITTDSGCSDTYCETYNIQDSLNTACQINVTSVINQVSVINGNDGSIDLTVTGGTPPYTYQWNTGAATQDISNLSSGVYTVAISTTPACPNYTYSFYVGSPLDSTNIIIDTLYSPIIDTCLNFTIDSFFVAGITVQGNTVIVEWVFTGGGAIATLWVTYTFTNLGTQVVVLTVSCGAKDLSTYISYIHINQIYGVEENTDAMQINLYPNPVSDFLNITFSNQTANASALKIFNMAGQQVYIRSIAANTAQVGINVSDLPSGVYFVTIDSGDGKPMLKKFLK